MKRRTLTHVLLVSLTAAATGCGGGETSSARSADLVPPTVTDSSGVRIVENHIPSRGVPLYGTVDSVPTLDIGATRGGDPHNVLGGVAGVEVLPNGHIVIANAADRQLRVYDRNGKYMGAGGGEGSEPGKFRSFTRMGRFSGDTLWVFDGAAGRMSFVDPDASVGSAVKLAGAVPWGPFGDGSFLLVPRWTLDAKRSGFKPGLRRDTATYLRWWPKSGDTVAVGHFPQDEIVVADTGGAYMAAVPPFGRHTVKEAGPGRFYVGDETSFSIGSYDPDGTLREIIRLDGMDLTLAPEEVQAARERMAAGKPEAPWGQKFWDAVPPTKPAYSRILLDATGSLWVAEYVSVIDFPRNWMVFSADGSLSGMVQIPAHFAPFEIGVDYILGVSIEGPGIEHVRRYALKRGT